MAEDKRAVTSTLSPGATSRWEAQAHKNASSEYFGRALAGFIKRWALYVFIASIVVIIGLAIIETLLLNADQVIGELYEDAFEICKTICTTLLGFTFASKLDDLLK